VNPALVSLAATISIAPPSSGVTDRQATSCLASASVSA
jgi:hypothetical protein